MKTIILLSPFPPTQNPRLLKEYQALKANGHTVKIWYAVRDKWAANYNDNKNKDFILVGGSYGSAFYYLTRFLHKFLKNILPIPLGYNRVSWLLYLKAITHKADLYIAHNLAALPIAVKAAIFHKTKCGFDAEDFHRQEVTDVKKSSHFKIAKSLEDKYLSELNYVTAASPLIASEYKKLYPKINPVVINNVFSATIIRQKKSLAEDQTLKLFWFSQTIGKNRGIEDAIAAIGLLKNKSLTLCLLGMLSSEVKTYLETFAKKSGLLACQLSFIEPVAPNEIFNIASAYDIGLALEPGFCLNNKIALSNKLYTYLTAGLAIVASETSAQRQFLESYSGIGKSFPIGDVKLFSEILYYYYLNRDALLETKLRSLKLAKTEMNWEKESQKFLHIINTVLC